MRDADAMTLPQKMSPRADLSVSDGEHGVSRKVPARYKLEDKQKAVRLVRGGQSMGAASGGFGAFAGTTRSRNRFFGATQVEQLRDMHFATRRQAKDKMTAWLMFYIGKRLHTTGRLCEPDDVREKGACRGQTARRMTQPDERRRKTGANPLQYVQPLRRAPSDPWHGRQVR